MQQHVDCATGSRATVRNKRHAIVAARRPPSGPSTMPTTARLPPPGEHPANNQAPHLRTVSPITPALSPPDLRDRASAANIAVAATSNVERRISVRS